MDTDRGYQAAIIAAINAELGGRGISRSGMLKAAGLSTDTMQRVFRMERDLKVDQIDKMARALGITPEYLMERASEWRKKNAAAEDVLASSRLDESAKQAIRNELASTRSGDITAVSDPLESRERGRGAS